MPRPHKTFPLEIPEYDLLCDIDEDLLQLVEVLNKLGFHTTGSCQEFKSGAAYIEFSEDMLEWRGRRLFNKLVDAIDDAIELLQESGGPGRECSFLLQKEMVPRVVDLRGEGPDVNTLLIDCAYNQHLRPAQFDRARRDAIEALEAAVRKRL